VARAEKLAAASGGSLLVTGSATEAVAGADVVATDTWVSMGTEADGRDRSTAFAAYAVTDELLAGAPDALVLHCLPAHRGAEITAEVLDGPRSVVWDEAENRRHVQKAVLAFLLDEQRRAEPAGTSAPSLSTSAGSMT
jgi:ornithine carbamoyltransferase